MSNDNVASVEKNFTGRKFRSDKSRDVQRSRQKGGNRDGSFVKNFKRKFERPREHAKRSKLEVGNRLKESDVGITEYIGEHTGFSAIIKERYTDFHVNEIDLDGQVAKLIHQDIPCEPCDNENIEDLKTLVSSAIWDQLCVLKEENASSSVEIDVTDLEKAERKTIHTIAKKLADVVSQTVDKNDKKFITIVPNTKGDKRDHKLRKDNRVDWKSRGGDYCHFLLHKVNTDTIDALNQLAVKLRIRPDNFSYAGTKDRRAWTTQWVSLKKIDPPNILRAGKSIHGVYVGNFKYAKDSLKLGMLRGNQFRIALRNARGTDEEIERAMTSLRDHGFINYYGLQRFGTISSIPTYEIGKRLLQGKWHEAIELILKPRPEEQDEELAEARRIYAETKDARAAYAKIERIDKIEARLLKGLQIAGDKNPLGALDSIPRNIRLLYIHAYQSFVWNHVVSRRIKEFGTDAIVGDLVYDKQNCKDNVTNEITDYSLSDDNIRDETNDTTVEEKDIDPVEDKAGEEENDFPVVKILTEEDLPNYTLADVVVPQPGWKVTYPPYAKVWFDEFLAKDELTTDLRQNNRKYSLSGAYRKILEIPMNLSWRIMHYENKHDNLILSDIDEIRKLAPPQDKPNERNKALIIEMCLKSSNYATMALREILKNDTSVETQVALSASHDVGNVQSSTNVIDECSRDSTEITKDNNIEKNVESREESADMI